MTPERLEEDVKWLRTMQVAWYHRLADRLEQAAAAWREDRKRLADYKQASIDADKGLIAAIRERDEARAERGGLQASLQRIEDKLAEAHARIAELEARVFDQGREHAAKSCNLGPMCPWCHIEACRSRIAELEAERE
ncbi:MAG: hypothetical protein DWQ20_00930 [Actinobacteria bacterium]|nr:MAG: hypothetical protein DWQ20_00930 [Actinomycetota bacterium]